MGRAGAMFTIQERCSQSLPGSAALQRGRTKLTSASYSIECSEKFGT